LSSSSGPPSAGPPLSTRSRYVVCPLFFLIRFVFFYSMIALVKPPRFLLVLLLSPPHIDEAAPVVPVTSLRLKRPLISAKSIMAVLLPGLRGESTVNPSSANLFPSSPLFCEEANTLSFAAVPSISPSAPSLLSALKNFPAFSPLVQRSRLQFLSGTAASSSVQVICETIPSPRAMSVSIAPLFFSRIYKSPPPPKLFCHVCGLRLLPLRTGPNPPHSPLPRAVSLMKVEWSVGNSTSEPPKETSPSNHAIFWCEQTPWKLFPTSCSNPPPRPFICNPVSLSRPPPPPPCRPPPIDNYSPPRFCTTNPSQLTARFRHFSLPVLSSPPTVKFKRF